AFVDEIVQVINRNGKNGQRRKHVKRQQRIALVHEKHRQRYYCHEVYEVHQRRAGEHAHATYVFRDAVHQVARAGLLEECHVQFLVMTENLILLIELDVSAHHDDRLPHEKKEESAHQRQQEDHNSTKYHYLSRCKTGCLYSLDERIHQPVIIRLNRLWLVSRKIERTLHKIDHKTCNLRSNDVEIVRKKDEYDARTQTDSVFPEVFIDCAEVSDNSRIRFENVKQN